MTLFTAIGLAGVFINLFAYALLSSDRLKASDMRYQLLNIAGTTGILVSLLAQWNLSVFVTNAAWLLVGIVGLVRILRLRGKA
jgi:hypothetical protein